MRLPCLYSSATQWAAATVETMGFAAGCVGEKEEDHNSGHQPTVGHDRKTENGRGVGHESCWRRPTLGLLILPSIPSFSPTIRRTARISVLPIKPNLAERAIISTINLDDYKLDPLTPPPSPSSPLSMAAYQRMIAETDPNRREEALTAYEAETSQNSVPVLETVLTICKYAHRALDDKESSLETLSVDELITQLRQVCEDAEDRASNSQEEAR
ncbi:hypothetical protein Tco_0769902 [Tanacetum coccineum]|uniref:Uncharacterized protein n=1 Tax=Tanacetum coccineum TaxID=301880 RepID=A0ABQ4ZCK2_9ASTR